MQDFITTARQHCNKYKPKGVTQEEYYNAYILSHYPMIKVFGGYIENPQIAHHFGTDTNGLIQILITGKI